MLSWNFALGHRAFSEEAGRDAVAPGELLGEREAHGYRQATGHDRVATVEPVLGIEQVHRTAVAARAAVDPSEHLGHDGLGETPFINA